MKLALDKENRLMNTDSFLNYADLGKSRKRPMGVRNVELRRGLIT